MPNIEPEVKHQDVLDWLKEACPEGDWYSSHTEFPVVIIGFGGENTVVVDYSPMQSGDSHMLIYHCVIDNPIEILFNGNVRFGQESNKVKEVLQERFRR